MPRIFGFLVVVALVSTPLAARQEPAPVRKAIDDYLRVQTSGLPGQVSYTIGNFDPNNHLAPCAELEVGQAPGARLWGRTTVAVRCRQAGGWSVFVPVHIRTVVDFMETARPLSRGQVITESDVIGKRGDLSELPAGVVLEVQQAVGRSTTIPIPAGRPLRADMLKQASWVLQGQSVKVVSRGPGFEVANEGRALSNAVEGQVVQVRLGTGQVVSGIASGPGQVLIAY